MTLETFLPLLPFIPFFLWLMFFQRRRQTPLSPAERRRALLIGSIGSVVALVLAAVYLYRLLLPA
jgi:uncharacterized membrane protein (DUF485 family)